MKRRIIVVGGGISGLAAAHRLVELSRERNLEVETTLLETSQRLGGSIFTESVDGFLVEAGPDSFISEKPWGLKLCERLGLTSRLISTSTAHPNVYIVHNGSLQPLPEGFLLLAPTRLWPLIQTPLFSWSGKLRLACDLFLPRSGEKGDESLASFVRRRLGDEVLKRVAQPLIGGIYAADPEELSLAATMPRFLELERTRRSIIWAMWSERQRRINERQAGSGARWSLFVTLKSGMREIVDALEKRLPVGTVRLGTKAVRLEWDARAKNWAVITQDREKIKADGLILAVPAPVSAAILSVTVPELAQELREIPYSSTATINLAYRREDVSHNLDGFGFVVPAMEGRKLIACTFSSVKYPGRAPHGYVLLRAFVGGALQPSLFEQDDGAMEASVRQELEALLGVEAPPLFCRIYRHPLSMPQYRVGHLDRIKLIEAHLKKLPGLALAGNAYHGVGMADCIHSGERAAEGLLQQLSTIIKVG